MAGPREIERKFLVQEGDLPPAFHEASPETIEQGYLVIDEQRAREVRLRRKDDRYLLTVKTGNGLDRGEGEIDLSAEQFDALWPFTDGLRLSKQRRTFPLEDFSVELDVYEGALEGLMVAEVEFPDAEYASRFEPPPWFGREVTEDGAYKNQQLARLGKPPSQTP